MANIPANVSGTEEEGGKGKFSFSTIKTKVNYDFKLFKPRYKQILKGKITNFSSYGTTTNVCASA